MTASEPVTSEPNDTERVTCPRCGNFVDALLDAPLSVCSECAPKIHIAPMQAPLSAGMVLASTVALLGLMGLRGLSVILAFELPSIVVVGAYPELPQAIQLAWGLVAMIGELTVLVMAHEALHGRPSPVGASMSRALRRYGPAFGTRWVTGILTALWSLLLVLPGLYKAVAYSMGTSITLFEGTDGAAAVDLSIERTRGHLLLISGTQGALQFAGVAWSILAAWAWLAMVRADPFLFADADVTAVGIAIQAVVQLPAALLTFLALLAGQVLYDKVALDTRLAERS